MTSFDDGFKNNGIFDSFYSGIHMPTTEWVPLFQAIQANLTGNGNNYLICDMTVTYTCYFRGTCSIHISDFESVYFNFYADRAYEVKPANYLLDYTDSTGANFCQIQLFGNTKNNTEYILGDSFMESFYVILNYENNAFALNGNYVSVYQVGEKANRDAISSSPLWIIIGAVAGVLVLVAIIGCIVVRQKNRRLQANLAKYDQL